MMNKLKVITSTTREGRKGASIGKWITDLSKNIEGFEVELIDLGELNLPMMNEPNHPRLGQYQYEYTKKWSETINESDAFIIVLAEYNYGFPAPIKNAIDYLFNEWKYKPVGIVSYGGVSGGLRATQMLKQVVTTLNMMPLSEQVSIPFFANYMNEKGNFKGDEKLNNSAINMMQHLYKWSTTMKKMRETM